MNLPKELRPQERVESVQVPIDMTESRELTVDQINRLQGSLGLIKVNGERLRALHDLGHAGEQLGSLRILKGSVMVSVDAIGQMIGAATAAAEVPDRPVKERQAFMQIVGYLSGQLIKVATGAVKMDRDVVEVSMEVEQKRRHSFQPGQAVGTTRAPQAGNAPIPA